MLLSTPRKIILILAGTLSLAAQGLLLLPERFSSEQASSGDGLGALVLGTISLCVFVGMIVSNPASHAPRVRGSALLLMAQLISFVGMYFLLDGMGTNER